MKAKYKNGNDYNIQKQEVKEEVKEGKGSFVGHIANRLLFNYHFNSARTDEHGNMTASGEAHHANAEYYQGRINEYNRARGKRVSKRDEEIAQGKIN